jgi:hypothetical protein
MSRTILRRISWPVVVAGLSAPFIANCGGAMPSMPGGGGAPGLPGLTGNCPDMAKVEAIESFDFEKEFKLKADVAAKIKAGAGAAVEMKELAAKIDGDLKVACGGLAKDLGHTGDFKDGQDACQAAVKIMGEVKAKMGANAKISLETTEPKCGMDIKAYGECSGHCDATVKPGEVPKCEPGKLQGSCSGKCEGECEASASAACTGECSGSCDVAIKGTCSGKCDGKCDGKATPAGGGAECGGTCEGKCSGSVKAECKGKCGGSCKMSAGAKCTGTCSGKCDVEMEAPKCTGKLEPPKVSAECKAKCDARVQAHASCTPPHIALRITGSADAAASAKFQAAVEKNLPAVLSVAVGMAKHVGELTASMEVVINGVQAGISGAGDAMTVGKLTACVGAPFKGALDAVASVKANVSVSVNVQASASASGSGKAG